MNIFFGKISQKFDTVQLTEGYYSAPRDSSWYGELQPNDYVYMIGGEKIQFWQAREWGEKNGNDCMYFDIINANLGISVSQFIALKFLLITKSLAVLTSRSTRNKAFFKLDFINEIPISDLSRAEFYRTPELYRTIKVIKREDVVENSEDIQLLYEDSKLHLIENNFIEDSIQKDFVDNLVKKGKGTKMKDNVLEMFSNAVNHLPTILTHKQIGFRSFYDTFFCEYTGKEKYFLVGAFWDTSNPQDQTARFISEGIWFNGYEDKFNIEVNAVPVGSNIAIKAAFVREKTKPVMTIKARGVVTENLQDGQTLQVDWEDDFTPFEVSFGGYMNTIKEVKKSEHIKSIWSSNTEEITIEIESRKNKDRMHGLPLNQILYGPPGTGKTYNSINKSLELIGDDIENKSREAIKEQFDLRMAEGRILFTTFHQSMSYEDFIEGIKPLAPEDGDKFIKYDIISGIFKQACANAAYQCYKEFKKLSRKSATYTFDDLHEAFIEHVHNLMDSGSPPVFKTLTGKDVTIIKITSSNSIKARTPNSVATRNPAPLTKENLQKLYDKFESVDEIKNLQQVKDTVEITPRITEFYAVFKGLKDFEKNTFQPENYWDETEIVDIISSDEKVKKFNEGVYKESVIKFGSTAAPVVLVIDEVNRGNVSQIFGELITLIEENKRLGNDEALEIILPYSKKKFSVPANLFIVGTMNTADRSVEALDTALRRRFTFEEMVPKPELLTPSAMYCRLLWKYEEVDWEDRKYKEKESQLFNFLGAPNELVTERKIIWEQIRSSGDRINVKYFDEFSFTGVNLKNLLATINSRIEKLIDKDHMIGHSYFLKVNDMASLQHAFEKEIIPLLQEYFFGDNGKISLVLGATFIEKIGNEKSYSFARSNGYDSDIQEDLKQKSIFKICSKNKWDFEDILL